MNVISPNNIIFKSPEFQKDICKFHLILKNFDSPDLELYSDEENYVICRGNVSLPTWIWTKDGFDKSVLPEIIKLILYMLTGNEKDKFTCKPELYQELIHSDLDYMNDDYFEMGFLRCYKTVPPKICDAFLDKPTEEDRDTLENYWFDSNQEMNGVDSLRLNQAQKDVDVFLHDENFYVLRNKDNKIVCMGSYACSFNQAKINHVYTPPEERMKGYAANLIYLLTNKIFDKGLIPMLYTDYNYKASNKAYMNVGYQSEGYLVNFSCSRQRNLNK